VSFKSRRMKNTVTKPSHGNRKRPASVPKKSQKKLRLNVAVFEPFSEPVGISFYKRIPSDPFGEHPPAFSLNGRHLPGELNMDMEQDEYLFTRFVAEDEAPYTVKAHPSEENRLFWKVYGHQKIADFFLTYGAGLAVQHNFVNQLTVWEPDNPENRGPVRRYRKYTLSFSMGRYSGNWQTPELLISYSGMAEVLNRPVSELKGRAEFVNWVINSDGRCVRTRRADGQQGINPSECKPVLNRKLREALGMDQPYRRTNNRYTDARKQINAFYKKYLNTPKFKELTGLRVKGFYQPEAKQIAAADLSKYPILFRKGRTAPAPFFGLRNYGPFKRSPEARPWILIVAPKALYQEFREKVVLPLIHGNGAYPGLSEFVHMQTQLLAEPVLYTDMENPEEEVIQKLSDYRFPAKGKGAVLFLSSISKFESNLNRTKQFFRIKEWLLNRGIVSQAFDADNMQSTRAGGILWWHQHVSTALLAKLGGVPWVTGNSFKKELIIGVGAFKPVWSADRFTGSAISFDNSGQFRGFDFFEGEGIALLCGRIKKALRMFIDEEDHSRAERIVIHFYKEIGWRDMKKILDVFYGLKCKVPVYLVTINKTTRQQEVAIDPSYSYSMPLNGTYIRLHGRNYLLFNNERKGADGKSLKDYPFPLKLSVRKIWGGEVEVHVDGGRVDGRQTGGAGSGNGRLDSQGTGNGSSVDKGEAWMGHQADVLKDGSGSGNEKQIEAGSGNGALGGQGSGSGRTHGATAGTHDAMDDGRTAESGSGNAHLGGQGSGSGQMNGATVDTHNVMDDGRKGRRSGGGHVPDEVVAELMEQIIRFSKMYWKSVNPQPLPVTIAYADLLAKQVCWFRDRKVPGPVQNVPFFL